MLHIPRYSEHVALLVKPLNLLLEGELTRAAQVLERQVGFRHARVESRLLGPHLFRMLRFRMETRGSTLIRRGAIFILSYPTHRTMRMLLSSTADDSKAG